MNRKTHTESCGNVFADLQLPNADDLLVKAALAARILKEAERRGLTQVEAATIQLPALKRGRLSGFSIERLLRFLLPRKSCTYTA
jgi:predicted XRE-type DNA-binding protein